jgi:hypothetical protein
MHETVDVQQAEKSVAWFPAMLCVSRTHLSIFCFGFAAGLCVALCVRLQ